jgi:hypothetical protein
VDHLQNGPNPSGSVLIRDCGMNYPLTDSDGLWRASAGPTGLFRNEAGKAMPLLVVGLLLARSMRE